VGTDLCFAYLGSSTLTVCSCCFPEDGDRALFLGMFYCFKKYKYLLMSVPPPFFYFCLVIGGYRQVLFISSKKIQKDFDFCLSTRCTKTSNDFMMSGIVIVYCVGAMCVCLQVLVTWRN